MSRRSGDSAGFTMFELLAVIAIMGVLAGIATLGVAKFRENASASAFCSDVDQVKIATSAYMAKEGPPIPGATSTARIDDLVQGRYLASKPSDSSLARISLEATGRVTVDGGQEPSEVCK